MRRGVIDLRLVVPAVVAWATAGVVVAAPDAAAATSVALWAVAAVLLAIALYAARGAIVVVAVCAAAAALVSASVAAQSPQRRPAVLLDAAADGRYVALLIRTDETLLGGEASAGGASAPGEFDAPYSATAVAVTVGGSVSVAVSSPVLVFGERPAGRTGIGSTLAVSGTLEEADAGDDVGFLVFADDRPRMTRPPPWFLDWANTLRAGFSAASALLPGDGGDLLPGLAIGDTAAVDDGLDAAMKATSLSHTYPRRVDVDACAPPSHYCRGKSPVLSESSLPRRSMPEFDSCIACPNCDEDTYLIGHGCPCGASDDGGTLTAWTCD